MKVLVHDGIGVWLAARRLNSGKFVWPREGALTATLSRSQFDALVLQPQATSVVEIRCLIAALDALGFHLPFLLAFEILSSSSLLSHLEKLMLLVPMLPSCARKA